MSKIVDIIESSVFFRTFGNGLHWTSGSSTIVYPIQHWVSDRMVEIQLNSNHRGIISSVRALVKSLKKDYPNAHYRFCKWDGSCPDTMRIYY